MGQQSGDDYEPQNYDGENWTAMNGCIVLSRNKQEQYDFEAEVISTYLDLKEMYDSYDRKYLARA
jgi:hypothetical protein